MGGLAKRLRLGVTRGVEALFHLYPASFRSEFSQELQSVFGQRMREVEDQPFLAWAGIILREINGGILSIAAENWHAIRHPDRPGSPMSGHLEVDTPPGVSGVPAHQPDALTALLWISGWTLATAIAIPAGLAAMAPAAVSWTWILDLGAGAGLWSLPTNAIVTLIGLTTSMGVGVGGLQWLLVRRVLPQAWKWILVTVAGTLITGLVLAFLLAGSEVTTGNPITVMMIVLPLAGTLIGAAQWLYLRRRVPNAYWVLLTDALATSSILVIGRSATSLLELLLVLALPGAISGIGLWLLVSQEQVRAGLGVSPEPSHRARRPVRRITLISLGVVALVPLFFAFVWVYAASQLALAKRAGVYNTPQEAIIARVEEGWDGAQVLRVENVHAGPNSRSSQPHVWFGGATVYLDRDLQGYDRDTFLTGSFYLRVEDGWVHVPEGAFPQFIGWVMDLCGMEGVGQDVSDG